MTELKKGDWIKIVNADDSLTMSVLKFKEKRKSEDYIFDTFYNGIEGSTLKTWIIDDVWLESELFRRDDELFQNISKKELNTFKPLIIKTILEGRITHGNG